MRIVERPHPVNPVRNPRNNELWLSEQQKRNMEFKKIYEEALK